MPRSLFGRLLGIATLTTIAALAFAAFSIGHVLERFLIHGLDQQLDAQVAILARAVRADGTLDRSRIVDLPPFREGGSAWRWQVSRPGELPAVASGPLMPTPDRRHRPGGRGPRPGEGRDAAGERTHFHQISVETSGGPVTIIASAPRRDALAPLREAMVPLLGSLALLGTALALATALQLRLGLRPLRALQASLADVRAGRTRHIPDGQPEEIAPLATELNALIDENEAGLAHARRHVSNLAHGLKTPLAALSVKLAESGRDPDGSLDAMVAQIDRRIRHHLGRARAAAPGSTQRMRTALAPAIADLVHALEHIHAGRGIVATASIAPDLVIAVDPQDLDEMAGNLLDNAWRHARTTIAIRGERSGQVVVLTIDDDGQGLSPGEFREALLPGRRLDERGDGHGFGLPITEELAELNGGTLALLASPSLSGLRVRLELPASL